MGIEFEAVTDAKQSRWILVLVFLLGANSIMFGLQKEWLQTIAVNLTSCFVYVFMFRFVFSEYKFVTWLFVVWYARNFSTTACSGYRILSCPEHLILNHVYFHFHLYPKVHTMTISNLISFLDFPFFLHKLELRFLCDFLVLNHNHNFLARFRQY